MFLVRSAGCGQEAKGSRTTGGSLGGCCSSRRSRSGSEAGDPRALGQNQAMDHVAPGERDTDSPQGAGVRARVSSQCGPDLHSDGAVLEGVAFDPTVFSGFLHSPHSCTHPLFLWTFYRRIRLTRLQVEPARPLNSA
jgi:hypothetical protein